MNHVEEHLSTADFVAGGKAAHEEDQRPNGSDGQAFAREDDPKPIMTGGQAAAREEAPGPLLAQDLVQDLRSLKPQDWESFHQTVIRPSADPNRPRGAYAVSTRKRRASDMPGEQ